METIKRFGMWKCSEGATVCICAAPERLPRSGGASGKGRRQSDGTPGHKKIKKLKKENPTMHCVSPPTPLRRGGKAIKAFIGFALKICSRQLKIITNQIKIQVAQTTIRPGHRLDLCGCGGAPDDGRELTPRSFKPKYEKRGLTWKDFRGINEATFLICPFFFSSRAKFLENQPPLHPAPPGLASAEN